MVIISNRPRTSRSSYFEITHAITPWIVLHLVQLLLLILMICCWWTNQITPTFFTVNKFEDGTVHFLDISLKRTSVEFIGSTQTLDSMSCFLVMNIGLAKLLDSLFQKQITVIKTFLLGNGFPKSVASNLWPLISVSDTVVQNLQSWTEVLGTHII